jgi:DNA-binding phage protein
MAKTSTSRYDVAEHLRTPQEMAAYLEACIDESNADTAFVDKALIDIARAQDLSQLRSILICSPCDQRLNYFDDRLFIDAG